MTFGDMQQQDLLFVDAGARGDVLFCPGTPVSWLVVPRLSAFLSGCQVVDAARETSPCAVFCPGKPVR